MADLELTFSIEGETQLLRRLKGAESDLRNWEPEFNKTGKLLLKTFRENFDSQGRTLGVTWPPLAPSTVAEKRRLGYPLTPLVRTGKMRRGFRANSSKRDVVIRNVQDYFVYHQSRQPRKKIPRRVMMKLDAKRKQLIIKIFQKSIESQLQKRGFARA